MGKTDASEVDEAVPQQRKRCWCWKYLCIAIILIPILIAAYAAWRFLPDTPVKYAQIEDHFKYGSLGGERNMGIPYWIWRAIPEVCADKLPDKQLDDIGFESVGFLYEGDNTLPIGVSSRRHLGIDRVFLTCAGCHTGTVRKSVDSEREVVLGMPGNRFNLMAFEKAVFQCVGDAKFNRSFLIPTIQGMGADLDLIDRYLVYPLAIWIIKERLQQVEDRLRFVYMQPDWGPGRVDTFSPAKAVFNWNWEETPRKEMIGTADLPSIWNQRQRKTRDDGRPMELHWDGNNDKVEERNLSASFATGAQPPIIDHEELGRIEDWLLDFKPPEYPFPIDTNISAQGKSIYEKYCANCHGLSGTDFSGDQVGKVVDIEEIGTDRWRLDNYTRKLSVNQSTFYTGEEQYRFKRFRKTNGYANMPLDGIWLRAPYLHNGSVPTLRDLLEPANKRPSIFYRGNDLYEPEKVGFVSELAEENGQKYFLFNTRIDGNSNQGHEGYKYGTELSDDKKEALVEYLKTF